MGVGGRLRRMTAMAGLTRVWMTSASRVTGLGRRSLMSMTTSALVSSSSSLIWNRQIESSFPSVKFSVPTSSSLLTKRFATVLAEADDFAGAYNGLSLPSQEILAATNTNEMVQYPVNYLSDLVDLLSKELNLSSEVSRELSEDGSKFIQFILSHCRKGHILPMKFVDRVLSEAVEYHRQLPNVVKVSRKEHVGPSGEVEKRGNVVIVGDTHGQFADYSSIFTSAVAGGLPSEDIKFVINGDMVDRGAQGAEIVISLLVAHAVCPAAVTVLRGNHETTPMNENYGFKREILKKYSANILKQFRLFFDMLPLAAVVENGIFVTHGGIGPTTAQMSIDQLNQFDRSVPDENLPPNHPSHELLWCDPTEKTDTFAMNSARGGGYLFGSRVTNHFLASNNLGLLVRSHEVKMSGYAVHHGGLCVTVFSAPNYCGDVGNKGAVLVIDGSTPDVNPQLVTFDSVVPSKKSMNRK